MRVGRRGALITLVSSLALAGCLEPVSMQDQLQSGTPPPSASPSALPNAAPNIAGTPTTSIMVGTTYLFQPAASDADGDSLSFTVTGLPSWATFDAQRGQISGTPSPSDAGQTADITISVTDGRAASQLSPFRITIAPIPNPSGSLSPGNTAPTLRGTPATQGQALALYRFLPQATDADSATLTFAIVNKPNWASFSTSTGELSGTPASAQAGMYRNIIISVSDGALTAVLPAFDITIASAPNQPPTISGSPAATINVGGQYHFAPSAADPEGETLTFSASNLPGWASLVSGTGVITGTPDASHTGTYAGVVLRVSDGTHSVALPAFSITVNAAPNAAPTIAGAPSTTATVGTAYEFRASAFDADGQTLTYSVANRPTWATFNGSTGILTGTPTTTDIGTYSNITVSVSDGIASASLAPFTVTVSAIPNAAPTISGSPGNAVTAEAPYSFTPVAADADGQSLTFTIANRPAWATFDPATGSLTGTPSRSHAGVFNNILISVSDGQASASLPAFGITVAAAPNRAPVVSGSPATSATAGMAYAFTPVASDADAEPLAFSVTNAPAWTSFDTSTGALTGTPNGAQVGTYANIVITVSDGQATSALPSFSITVTAAPNNAPVISGSPATAITAGNLYVFQPSASDADGQGLTFSIANQPNWTTFDPVTGALSGIAFSANVGNYANIVISVTDGTATTALPGFTIVVNAAPNNAPTISGTPPTNVVAGNAYSFTANGYDPDGDPLTYSISNRPGWASFSPATGTLSGTPSTGQVGTSAGIVITVSDGQASAALAAFSITVSAPANIAPVISGSPVTAVNSGVAYLFTPTAADADGQALTFSITNRPVWATFNTATGALGGTPGSQHVGPHSDIRISVSDGTATTTLPPFTITVVQVSGSASLSWTAPTQNDDDSPLTNLAGYRVYQGSSSGSLSIVATISNPNITSTVIENLASGTHYFAVSAYTVSGVEGARSTVGSKTIP